MSKQTLPTIWPAPLAPSKINATRWTTKTSVHGVMIGLQLKVQLHKVEKEHDHVNKLLNTMFFKQTQRLSLPKMRHYHLFGDSPGVLLIEMRDHLSYRVPMALRAGIDSTYNLAVQAESFGLAHTLHDNIANDH